MATFTYKARDAAGKAVKGVMEGAAKAEVIDKLHKMGYIVTNVGEAAAGMSIESVSARFRRVSAENMIVFYVQLANMINAGISILTSLDALGKQAENKKLSETVENISRAVEAGDSFSEALSRHPGIFSKAFVSMVKAGEASGKLDNVLVRYAEYAEHQADLREKIKGALFYPIILLIAGIAVTLFIVTFIIPQFAEIFMESGIKLPFITQMLYNIGIGIKNLWLSLILFAVVIWFGIRYYGGTKEGRANLDRFKLKIPTFGSLLRKAAISRFARTLGTLTASAVPILQSLDIVKDVVGNEVLAAVLRNARQAVERGEKLSESLKVSGEFPPDTVQMIASGEDTGNLDGMLNKISDFYDMSLTYSIKRITTVIEPLFLVIMGSMVGFIMASMLMPIFDMIKILRH